jgi:hypothetical protein
MAMRPRGSRFASRTFAGRHKILTLVLVALAFVATGAYVTVKSQNYITAVWRIARCDWHPPGPQFVMVSCASVIPEFYRTGALYLDVEPRLTKALRDADVIVTGNSTTIETFAVHAQDNLMDRYFRDKGLKFFIMAEEGSGFRYRKMILEKLGIHPRTALIDTDDVGADLLQDSNKEVIFNEDRFRWPFTVFHLAIVLQHNVCVRWNQDSLKTFIGSQRSWRVVAAFKNFYCNGNIPASWRNVETGAYILAYKREPTKRMQLIDRPDTRMATIELFRRRAKMMLGSESLRHSCIIFYEVASPAGMPEVGRTIAREAHRPFIFPPLPPEKQYFVYDGSHMEEDTAERWTAEFLPLLDPDLDRCVFNSYLQG